MTDYAALAEAIEIADAPNPGSVEAKQFSCTCPVIDNHYGEGRHSSKGQVFIYSEGCPLHWPKGPTDDKG